MKLKTDRSREFGVARTFLCLSICVLSSFHLDSAACAQLPATDEASIAAIQQAANGLGTVGELDLPRDFLRRVAYRDIRAAFRKSHRRADGMDSPSQSPTRGGSLPDISSVPFAVHEPAISRERIGMWTQLPFDVPELRGFRAPSLDETSDPWPFHASRLDRTAHDAARFVAQHLATKGLIRTTMQVMTRHKLNWMDDNQLNISTLRTAGIPTDWLRSFQCHGNSATDVLAQWYVNGADASVIDDIVESAAFGFLQSCPGFAVLTEDSTQNIGAVRFQLPTNAYVRGEGDGSVLDVFRQLVQRDNDCEFWVSIHRDGWPRLYQFMDSWNISNPQRLTVTLHPANITQWAQDNAKAGIIRSTSKENDEVVSLIPRYASRSEVRTEFVPSDSLAFESLKDHVGRVIHSPLLFQGGNLIPVTNPHTGQRILLIGESEIHRNRALGLTKQQTIDAFKVEFGVDECDVLPAVSFHIDLDVTVRRIGNRLVACVIDHVAGSRFITACGVRTLNNAGILDDATATHALTAMESSTTDDDAQALALLWTVLSQNRSENGTYSQRVASAFAVALTDSGPRAMLRFLAGLDVLTAMAGLSPPSSRPNDTRDTAAYHNAIRRQDDDRRLLISRLEDLGMEVHLVPGLSDHMVSMNTINGLQLEDRFLMPVYGGVFKEVDRAAMDALQDAFGLEVTIEPIQTAAMQDHDGGIHCLVGLYPKPSEN